MSELLLKLISKYEGEIQEIEKYLDENDPSKNMEIRLAVTIERNKEFIRDLDTMLNMSF